MNKRGAVAFLGILAIVAASFAFAWMTSSDEGVLQFGPKAFAKKAPLQIKMCGERKFNPAKEICADASKSIVCAIGQSICGTKCYTGGKEVCTSAERSSPCSGYCPADKKCVIDGQDRYCFSKNVDCENKNYKMAFILLVNNLDEATPERINKLSTIKGQFSGYFHTATGNQAQMDTSDDVYVMLNQGRVSSGTIELFNITREFYKNHADVYDFLTVYTSFYVDQSKLPMFHVIVVQNIKGIGYGIWDNSDLYGSGGKLKGINIMDQLYMDALFPSEFSINGLLHETGHQWCCYVGDNFAKGQGGARLEIIQQGIHFYRGLQSPSESGDAMGSDYWVANSDGTYRRFINLSLVQNYHSFQRYFMGLLPQNSFSDKFQIYDAGIVGVDFNDQKAIPYKQVSIQDIIAVAGVRECASLCGDGIKTGSEVCDTKGNVGCSSGLVCDKCTSCAAGCADSDWGFEVSSQGTVTGISPDGKNSVSGTDYCIDKNRLMEFICNGTINYGVQGTVISCPNGCFGGACVRGMSLQGGTCVDNDKDGYCNWGTIGTFDTIPSYCPASCKPWKDCDDGDSQKGACTPPCDQSGNCISCIDSDNGYSIYAKGVASGTSGGFNAGSGEDRCSDPYNLIEFICNGTENNGVQGTFASCLGGCKDGACINLPAGTCVDNDKDGYCNWDWNNEAITPPSCLTNCQPWKDCDDSNANIKACPTSVPVCLDTDGGFNTKLKGRASGTMGQGTTTSIEDSCSSATTLVEAFCNVTIFSAKKFNGVYSSGVNCPNGCSDGACK